jgi:predicted ATP-grasp superfamily ATP-dependent carboligase
MTVGEHLIICGASTRAAAFSALRAGLKPWCIDLFADEDLKAKCPVMRIPRSEYPHKLPEWIERYAPPGPWMYTGALENQPKIIERISKQRPLWGIEARQVARVRNPKRLRRVWCPTPKTRFWRFRVPRDGSWLLKPLCGSGGRGIRRWFGETRTTASMRGRKYFQEIVEGMPCAALYLGMNRPVWPLGLTRQLVGEDWLHAWPFAYCGSIGPLATTEFTRSKLVSLGTSLARVFQLRGLFGVDCILKDDIPWGIEVNPRYSASVEVVELASGGAFLSWGRQIFYTGPVSDLCGSGEQTEFLIAAARGCYRLAPIGKAILFAKDGLVFPGDGPWTSVLRYPRDVWDVPGFADIPAAGTPIAAGQPILTFFVQAITEEACLEELKRIAAELDRWLYKGK